MVFKTLGKSTDEAVEIIANEGRRQGAKAGAKAYKQSIKNVSKTAKKEAMENAYNRGVKEATAPKAASGNSDIYFRNADGVEYRRITNPNYAGGKRKSNGGQYNQFLYQQRDAGGKFTSISGKQFGAAKQAYGGAGYASYDDMLLGGNSQIQEAAEVAQEAAESGAGWWSGLGEMAQEHPYVAAGIAGGVGLAGGALLFGGDDD